MFQIGGLLSNPEMNAGRINLLLPLRDLGEAFTEDEWKEFASAAIDPDKGAIYYADHAAILPVDEDVY